MAILHRKLTRTIGIAALGATLVTGCGKKSDDKDDDDDTSAAPSGNGGGGVTPGTLELMPAIDVSCGGKNCYGGDAAASLALLGQGDSALQTMRLFAWLIVGFPSEAKYLDAFGGTPTEEQKNAIPQSGMIGFIEDVRKDVVTLAQAADPTLTKCTDAPSSGSFTDDHGVLTWTTPTLAAPASFGRSGAYEKAVTYKSADGLTEGRFEFFCDQDRMAVVIKRTKDDKPGWMSFYYDHEDATKLHAQFFVRDEGYLSINNDPNEKLDLGLFLDTDDALGTVTSHVARAGNIGDDYQGYRYAISGKADGTKISYYIAEVGTGQDASGNSQMLAKADWDANALVNSKAVTDDDAASSDAVVGCTDSYDSNGTGGATCSGYDLSEASAPGLDADGAFSMKWSGETLPAKLKAIVP